jgi:hypothetical protein
MADPIDPRELARNAQELLTKLLMAGRAGASAAVAKEFMQPRPDDYAKAFEDAVAEGVRQVYEPLWAQGQLDPRPKAGQTEIRLWGATSEDLKLWNANARQFPGGYEGIAAMLKPGRIWLRWKFVEPGETLGMAFDGLVWMDDHWAWFPKPWRAIRMTSGETPPAIGEA